MMPAVSEPEEVPEEEEEGDGYCQVRIQLYTISYKQEIKDFFKFLFRLNLDFFVKYYETIFVGNTFLRDYPYIRALIKYLCTKI